MQIELCYETGYLAALYGIGLSYGLTSKMRFDEFRHSSANDLRKKLHSIALNLIKKGEGEDKFLRQMAVCFIIRAPRYWWTQMDTYKVGTTAQSESTMHTIMRKEILREDFEIPLADIRLDSIIDLLNVSREARDFHTLIRMLPQSYVQRRIWSANYAVLRNIFIQRAGHPLSEWRKFIDTVSHLVMYPEFLPCRTQ